ncbi:MAG: polysaccharide deacetylase, partial [Oscillospiraceae bacterium]
IVRGGCYPYGCVNENIMLAAKAAGLEYVRGDGCCYDFGLPANWLNWLPTCSHNYKELMPLAQKFTQDNVIRDPYLFYVWGHSYEFDRDNTWDVMDDLLKTVSAKKDVWYATTGEIYDYVNAYNSLKYSCTGDMVFNPTNTEVCFECDFVPIKVKPGHTVKL